MILVSCSGNLEMDRTKRQRNSEHRILLCIYFDLLEAQSFFAILGKVLISCL